MTRRELAWAHWSCWGSNAIVPRPNALGLPDDAIGSRAVWDPTDDAELEDAVDAARDARIVIMNPPFTNRAKMGEKFPPATPSSGYAHGSTRWKTSSSARTRSSMDLWTRTHCGLCS